MPTHAIEVVAIEIADGFEITAIGLFSWLAITTFPAKLVANFVTGLLQSTSAKANTRTYCTAAVWAFEIKIKRVKTRGIHNPRILQRIDLV